MTSTNKYKALICIVFNSRYGRYVYKINRSKKVK